MPALVCDWCVYNRRKQKKKEDNHCKFISFEKNGYWVNGVSIDRTSYWASSGDTYLCVHRHPLPLFGYWPLTRRESMGQWIHYRHFSRKLLQDTVYIYIYSKNSFVTNFYYYVANRELYQERLYYLLVKERVLIFWCLMKSYSSFIFFLLSFSMPGKPFLDCWLLCCVDEIMHYHAGDWVKVLFFFGLWQIPS